MKQNNSSSFRSIRGIEDGDSSHFEKNEDNPIEADAVILDEMSMVDIHLMYSLLKAIVPEQDSFL